jgi:hypothetical protein
MQKSLDFLGAEPLVAAHICDYSNSITSAWLLINKRLRYSLKNRLLDDIRYTFLNVVFMISERDYFRTRKLDFSTGHLSVNTA